MGTIYRNGVPFVGSGGAGGVEMTQAEYDLLPTSEKMNGAIYFITDGDVSYPSASQMRYDNTESQIPATSVQGAIDENRIEINGLKSGLMSLLYPTTLLNSSSNMDNIDCGTYYQSGGSMPSNAPSGANNAYIVVLKARNVDRFQIWIARNTANIQIRMTSDWNESTGTGANWTAWTVL